MADLFDDVVLSPSDRPNLADRLLHEADRLNQISTRWESPTRAARETDLRDAAAILKAKAQGEGGC